ncbi:MAG: hypothetical protein LDL16_05355 [Thiobacillus sp.]|nr:hypothetical protein [Thiobacillus sp.]
MAHLQAVRTTLQPEGNAFTQLTTYFDPHSQIAWGCQATRRFNPLTTSGIDPLG